MTIWVLTEEYNDYDQHGEYFLHAWDHKPTAVELAAQGVPTSSICCDDLHAHILNGGGRIEVCKYYDYNWYYLKEIK